MIFEPGSKKSAPGTGQGIFETGYGDTIFEQGHFEVLGHIFYGGRKPPSEEHTGMLNWVPDNA